MLYANRDTTYVWFCDMLLLTIKNFDIQHINMNCCSVYHPFLFACCFSYWLVYVLSILYILIFDFLYCKKIRVKFETVDMLPFTFLNYKLYFRAVLGLQQNWAENAESSHIPIIPTSPQSPPLSRSCTWVVH